MLSRFWMASCFIEEGADGKQGRARRVRGLMAADVELVGRIIVRYKLHSELWSGRDSHLRIWLMGSASEIREKRQGRSSVSTNQGCKMCSTMASL
jgi:hypothetical protein